MSKRSQFDWRTIRMLADALTPDQLAELLEIKRASLFPGRCPIRKSHYHGGVIGPLVRRKLIAWHLWPAWGGNWRMPQVTPLGEMVFLLRVEQALRLEGYIFAASEYVDGEE